MLASLYPIVLAGISVPRKARGAIFSSNAASASQCTGVQMNAGLTKGERAERRLVRLEFGCPT